jgi:hypothetical protein
MDKQQIELNGHRALVEEVYALAEQVQALAERVRKLENTAKVPSRPTGKPISKERDQEPTRGDKAAEWLLTFLAEAGEPVLTWMVIDAAQAAGFSRGMIYRARKTLDLQIANSLGRKHPQNGWMLRPVVVAELGHGWRIERQPTPPNAAGATSDPVAVPNVAYLGGDELTDIGLSYAEVDASLRRGLLASTWIPAGEPDWVTTFAADADAR